MDSTPERGQKPVEHQAVIEDIGLDVPPAGPTADLGRARAELAKLPAAVQGKGGRAQTWEAVVLLRKLGLDADAAGDLLVAEYNSHCVPPWAEADIRNMCRRAHGGRGGTGPHPAQMPARPDKADLLDRAYRLLLARLPLYHADVQSLRRRGLTDEEIAQFGYKSWTTSIDKLKSILLIIAETVGAERIYEVPGIVRTEFGPEFAFLQDALVVPVRDAAGRVLGLRLRVEKPRVNKKGFQIKDPKGNVIVDKTYLWLSGGKDHKEDARVVVCAHVPVHDSQLAVTAVRITEGEIKADIATTKTGLLTISVPGVTNWRVVLEVLKELGATRVLIAYDADSETNRDVARSILDTHRELTSRGHEVVVETWKGKKAGKGIDDVAVSGHLDQVRTLEGDGARSWLDGLAVQHGLSDRVSKPSWEFGADDGAGEPPSATRQTSHPSTSNPVPAPRIAIRLGTDLERVNDEAIAVLAMYDDGIYQRGFELVRAVRLLKYEEHGIERPDASPRTMALEDATVQERLAALADWESFHQRQGWVRAIPPERCVRAVQARRVWDGIRPLNGVVEVPVLRPNGTVLDRPGYDHATGLLYIPSIDVGPIPTNPTRDDALKAKDELLEVVVDFPFESPAHQSAWLAALETLFAMPAMSGPAPMFLADANVRGAGKNLLLDAISTIVFGRAFARMAHVTEEAEVEKRITAIALAGDTAVLLDNIRGPLGGAAWEAALTSRSWRGRRLGVSEDLVLPLNVVWFGTGNNIEILGDMTRRIIHIRLRSMEERPEERSAFNHADLLAWIRTERARLIRACLTILRAYFAAGRPAQPAVKLGSFESWAGIVASALVWVGLPDPCSTRAAIETAAESDTSKLGAVLWAWQAEFGLEAHTAPDVLRLIEAEDKRLSSVANLDLNDSGEHRHQALKDAILTFSPGRDGRLPSARSLGRRLGHFKHRVVSGVYVEPAGEDGGGSIRWRVVKVTPAGQPTDEAGFAGFAGIVSGDLRGRENQVSPDSGADTAPTGTMHGTGDGLEQSPQSLQTLPTHAQGAAEIGWPHRLEDV